MAKNFLIVLSIPSYAPSGVLEHVPEDGVRGLGVVVAHPDERPPHLVLLHDVLDPLDDVGLAWKVGPRLDEPFPGSSFAFVEAQNLWRTTIHDS